MELVSVMNILEYNHYIICSIGAIANSTLILLIITRTPKKLRSYSMLILSMSLLEMCTLITSAAVFPRLLPTSHYLIIAVTGPCRFTQSIDICLPVYGAMLHGHSHFGITLGLSFCYREVPVYSCCNSYFSLYIITRESPPVIYSAMTAFLVYLPTLAICIAFGTGSRLKPAEILNILHVGRPLYEFSDAELLMGGDLASPTFLSGIFWVCCPIMGVYILIVNVAYRIHRTLAIHEKSMSVKTRQSHREIIKGLIIQACLPTLYVFAVSSYAIQQFNIYHALPLEYIPHSVGDITILLSPFVTLYFVRPYREALLRIVTSCRFKPETQRESSVLRISTLQLQNHL
uniref:G protein-coupled receptor n=1 Tax=Pristionchus pacificus TaxID=54126 RepID=A0A8R1YTE3_PRIPA